MSTQEKIANVLSAYDDLTENNDKRIKVLEAMAQKLYTEWFVNFKFPRYKKVKMVASGHPDFGMVPEVWEVKSIGEIVKVKKGKNITKDTVSIGSVPVVAGGLEPAYYHNIANAKGPVITISASGANAGFINLYHQDIWASDCSYMNKDLTDFVFFFYLFLKINQGKIFDLQRGSAQPHVYPKDIMSLNFIYPTQTILKDFESIVKSYFIQVANLQKQNLNLKKSRDFLIPQLVGGRVEVK